MLYIMPRMLHIMVFAKVTMHVHQKSKEIFVCMQWFQYIEKKNELTRFSLPS